MPATHIRDINIAVISDQMHNISIFKNEASSGFQTL